MIKNNAHSCTTFTRWYKFSSVHAIKSQNEKYDVDSAIAKPYHCFDLFCSWLPSSMPAQSQSYRAIYSTFNIIHSEVIVYTPSECSNHPWNSTHNAEQIQIRVSWKGMSNWFHSLQQWWWCRLIILQTLSVRYKRERKIDRARAVRRDKVGETGQQSSMRSEVKTWKKRKKRGENMKEENGTMNTDAGAPSPITDDIYVLSSMI